MTDYIARLAAQAQQGAVSVTAELDRDLADLDRELEALAPQLEVEYVGPGVGMADMNAEHVFRLVVRHHVWDVNTAGWGLKVCDALPNCEFRPMWPVQGTGRLRKKQLVKALPAFFAGYLAAIRAAGKADTAVGRRVQAMAAAFGV